MMTPSGISDIFIMLMLAVVVISAAKLVGRYSAWRRAADEYAGPHGFDADLLHLLMGLAMAGMLTSRLGTLPDGVWKIVFAAATVWFAWRVCRETRQSGARVLFGSSCASHLAHCAAMLYMFLVVTTPAASGSMPTMAGMSMTGPMQPGHAHALRLIFALPLIGFTVRDINRLARPSGASAPGETGRRIAMGIAMAFMLITVT